MVHQMTCYKHNINVDLGFCIVCDRDQEILQLEKQLDEYRKALECIAYSAKSTDVSWIAEDALKK